MEDKYLYMKSKNNCLPYLSLVNEEYIFIGDFKDSKRNGRVNEKELDSKNFVQIILPIASIIDNRYQVNEQGIIEERNPYCKYCHSSNFARKGFNWRTICLEKGILIRVKVKRYRCKCCRRYYQTEFPDLYEKYYNFSENFKKLVRKHVKNGYLSLRHLKKLIKSTMGLDISHESIRKFLIETDSLYYRDDSFKPSGYYGFDSQWVKIEKVWRYRLALFDLVNNRPLAESIVDKEDKEVIKEFLVKTIAPKDRKAIVTDKGQGYESVMSELKFAHQLCTFHLEKNLWDLIIKESNKIGREYRKQLKKDNPKMSKSKLNEKRDKKKKEFKEDMKKYVNEFMEFKDKTKWKEAENYIQSMKTKLHTFPEFLEEYIKKNFMPIYKKYIIFLEKDFKGKLDSTNNKIENYFGNTLPKRIKNIFRTKQGLFNFISNRKKGWVKNNA